MTLRNGWAIAALGAALWMSTSVSMADAISIEKLQFDKGRLPKSLRFSAEIAGGARWLDKLGENILVVTVSAAKSGTYKTSGGLDGDLRGYHFVSRGGSWAPVWKNQDSERDCPALFAAYLPETLTVTDLDKNGIAEVVFIYRLGCSRTDLSPSGFKLLMQEGADAYVIRSETFMSTRRTLESEMKPDPAFAKAPASFKAYAIQQWRKHKMDNR